MENSIYDLLKNIKKDLDEMNKNLDELQKNTNFLMTRFGFKK